MAGLKEKQRAPENKSSGKIKRSRGKMVCGPDASHSLCLSEFYHMSVEQVMDRRSWDLPVVDIDASVETILSMLTGKDHVWVVRSLSSYEYAGIITEKNILDVIAPPRVHGYTFKPSSFLSLHHSNVETARELMTAKTKVCRFDTRVKEVIDVMIKYHYRRMPVVERKRLVGEVTLHDLIKVYALAITHDKNKGQ